MDRIDLGLMLKTLILAVYTEQTLVNNTKNLADNQF